MTKTASPLRPARRLPEASQIAQLLSEVMPANGTVQAAPAAHTVQATGPVPLRSADRVAEFFSRVNWRNDPAFGGVPAAEPAQAEPATPPGGMAVGAFFGQVNWKNERRPDPRTIGGNPYLVPNAQRPKADAERSVEAVLTRFAWD